MRLIAFLQLYNELENGHLIRCLENCKRWADDIFIYDDCSTDGSIEIYKKYTESGNVILGHKRSFDRELFHKQELLNLVLRTKPDWIGWIDGDAILSRSLTDNCREYLKEIEGKGYDGCRLHNMNLWRSECYYRLDSKFDRLWHVVFWKNNGQLNYSPVQGLHRQQFPQGFKNIGRLADDSHRLLHYGFTTEEMIVRKYLTYKWCSSHGSVTKGLDRLITEGPEYSLAKCPKFMYPIENIPPNYDTESPPLRIDYSKYRKFSSYPEYRASLG